MALAPSGASIPCQHRPTKSQQQRPRKISAYNVTPKQEFVNRFDLPIRAMRLHRPPGAALLARSHHFRHACPGRPGTLELLELALKTAVLRVTVGRIVSDEMIDVAALEPMIDRLR
jgi:hypothetical protein